MKKGVSAIIYCQMGENYFLILHRNSNWQGWEFAKGGIEEGEDPDRAVMREIKEETGLTAFEVVGRISEQRKFTSPEGEEHAFDVYLVKSNMNIPVHIDKKEHDTFLWTTKDRVIEKLTWPEEKELFIKTTRAMSKMNGS